MPQILVLSLLACSILETMHISSACNQWMVWGIKVCVGGSLVCGLPVLMHPSMLPSIHPFSSIDSLESLIKWTCLLKLGGTQDLLAMQWWCLLPHQTSSVGKQLPIFCIGILIDCLRVWSVDVFTRSNRSCFQYIIALPVIWFTTY